MPAVMTLWIHIPITINHAAMETEHTLKPNMFQYFTGFTHCMHFSAASLQMSSFTPGDPSDADFWLGRGTGHSRSSSGSSVSTSPANPVCGPVIGTSPPSPSSPLTFLVAASAALIATN